jgi:hypothetical protein
MDNLTEKIISAEPPTDLLAKTLYRVRWERQRRKARLKLAFWGTCLLAAASGLGATLIALQSESEATGFAAILRLLFSDLRLVGASGADLAFSLLESVPAAEIGFSLLLGYFAVTSFKRLLRAVQDMRGAALQLKTNL